MATTASELSPLQAYNLLMAFASRYGENALRLALHAALPQVLRTDLLHLMRLNFVPESIPDLAVEADVLFAPFCQDLGNGYYRFDQSVRLQLLQNLDPAYAKEPTPRSVLIARFLLSYIEQQSRSSDRTQDRLYADYLEVERWGALGFLDPEVAAAQLAAALQLATSSGEIAVRIRVAGLATALSTPLARYGKLLAYAAGLEAMETGKFDQAKQLLESLDDAEIEIGKIRLKSPRRVLLERLQPPVNVVEPVEILTEQEDQSVEQQSSKVVRNEVFISYSHNDRRWADELQKHLVPLPRQGIKVWYDTQLSSGVRWDTVIKEAIDRAQVAVVLASQEYFTSDYLMNEEFPRLIALAKQGELRLAWVCVEPCHWQHTDLAKFHAAYDPNRPISQLSGMNRSKALIQVSEAISKFFNDEPTVRTTRWGERPARLVLDRDEQKALVGRHLKELARSDSRRIMALVAYAAPGNLLDALPEQLQAYLDLELADMAEINWKRLRFPDFRDKLQQDLVAELKLQLQADPDEFIGHLLRRHAPRVIGSGKRAMLWLNWGTFGQGDNRQKPLTSKQLEEWLRFCSDFLSHNCPTDLRVVCYAAIETAGQNHPRLAKTLQEYGWQPWCRRPEFRLSVLPPLGKVEESHLYDFLVGGQSSCDPTIRAEIARRLIAKTGGVFEPLVALIEEAEERGSWSTLLTQLQREQGSAPTAADNEPF